MSEVSVSCLCGELKTRVQLRDNVPLKTQLCHNSQCRYNLGALSHSLLPLKDRPDDLDKLQTYTSTEGHWERFFCPTCGSHIFEKVGEVWNIQSGVVEEVHSEHVLGTLEQVIGHVGVEETKDGGISNCFDIEACMLNDDASQNTALSTAADQPDIQLLEAGCVCGGVRFLISRPNAGSIECSSPWPDLIVPYHQQSSENPDDVKWWVRDNKWLAGTCACRSCRLGLGSPIQAWTFVSRSNLLDLDGNELRFGLGTMKAFSSSPGAQREFCSRCGATILWHNEERPGVVDVSVGVLRAPDGALARSWLSWWTERVSFAEQAFDQQLIKELESNLSRLSQSLSVKTH